MKNFILKLISLLALVFTMSFTANAQTGCLLPSACNYSSVANVMEDVSICDFSCYGCMDQTACNYNEEVTEPFDYMITMDIENELYDLGLDPWSLDLTSLYSSECVLSNDVLSGVFDDACDCVMDYSENFNSSSAYFGTGYQSTHNLTPWTCGGVAVAGNSTGSQITANVTYPCDIEQGFYINTTGSGQVNLTIPITMSTFTLIAETGSTSFSVYYNPSTTTIVNNTNTSGTVSFIETSELELISLTSCTVYGCTDLTAFNYNELANSDDSSCIAVVVGCMTEGSFNFDSSANTDDESCISVVQGCIDATASNYNEQANTSDNSCITWEAFATELQNQIAEITPEDGVSQADVDSVQALLDAVIPEDGITQADVDEVQALLDAVVPEDGVSQADVDSVQALLDAVIPIKLELNLHLLEKHHLM